MDTEPRDRSAERLTDIPVIDIGPYFGNASEAKRDVVRTVRKACEDIGFFVITGHRSDEKLCARMFAISRAFFDLPLQEKLKVQVQGAGLHGYSPLMAESVAYSRLKNVPGDLKESLMVTHPDDPDDPYYRTEMAAQYFGENFWPEQPVALREVWTGYWREMERLSTTIAHLFALALDLPDNFFDAKNDKAVQVLRALNYPEQVVPPLPEQLRIGPHSDYGDFTIVRHEEGPQAIGLQVQTRDGRWIDVPHVGNSFTVNVGDMMARWSNDLWTSAMHRVLNPPRSQAQSRRMTIAFFHFPNYDATIECLPTCCGVDRLAKYQPVTAGEYLMTKHSRQVNYPDKRVASADP
jgi:isopenicillin N synthase-like dioxygenase